MYKDKSTVSVMIVSASEKAEEYLRDIMNSSQFQPVVSARSISEARRINSENQYDIVIINTPLQDDFGIEFAEQICEDSSTGVLLLVKNELYEQVCYKVEEYGILTFAKPGTKQTIFQAIKILVATHFRLAAYEKKAVTLEAKMKEIRLINRAKWVLIDRYNMNEAEAHKYIEKTAMDSCVKRGEIAENIIRTYGN